MYSEYLGNEIYIRTTPTDNSDWIILTEFDEHSYHTILAYVLTNLTLP